MYVYILKSIHHAKFYTGITSNPKTRLHEHNSGKCKSTSPFKPWTFKNIFWFDDAEKAFAFEKYLKSGSGRAFVNKHF